MKSFEVLFSNDAVVEVEFENTDALNGFWSESFRRSFYPYYNLTQHASHIAFKVLEDRKINFLEGYGDVSYLGHNEWKLTIINPDGSHVSDAVIRVKDHGHDLIPEVVREID